MPSLFAGMPSASMAKRSSLRLSSTPWEGPLSSSISRFGMALSADCRCCWLYVWSWTSSGRRRRHVGLAPARRNQSPFPLYLGNGSPQAVGFSTSHGISDVYRSWDLGHETWPALARHGADAHLPRAEDWSKPEQQNNRTITPPNKPSVATPRGRQTADACWLGFASTQNTRANWRPHRHTHAPALDRTCTTAGRIVARPRRCTSPDACPAVVR
jgi:hypothetical protein